MGATTEVDWHGPTPPGCYTHALVDPPSREEGGRTLVRWAQGVEQDQRLTGGWVAEVGTPTFSYGSTLAVQVCPQDGGPAFAAAVERALLG